MRPIREFKFFFYCLAKKIDSRRQLRPLKEGLINRKLLFSYGSAF